MFVPVGKTIIYIPHSGHGGGSMSSEDFKVMVGVFIVLNIIWAIFCLVELFRYIKRKKDNYYMTWDIWDTTVGTQAVSLVIFTIWVIVIIGFLGNLIGGLL